jgi:hypothetical protein
MSTEPKSLKQTWEALPKLTRGVFIFIGAWLLIGIFGSLCSNLKDGESSKLGAVVTDSTIKAKAANDSIAQRKADITNLKDAGAIDYAAKVTDLTSIMVAEAVMIVHRGVIDRHLNSADSELKALAIKAKPRMIAAQQRAYPKLRKIWAEIKRQDMWEHDVFVEFNGSTLYITGGIFAANKNIAEAQKQLTDMLTMLRFKHTQYRWYKGQDDWQGYDMQTKADGDISTD